MKRILVPINFSSTSSNSLHFAYLLAKYLNVDLSLLHCYPSEEHEREFDFGKKDYSLGIKEMLKDFYKSHIDEKIESVQFLAYPGPISKKISGISKKFQFIVLSSNKFSSNLNRWLSSKGSYIASNAKCPVLIIPFLINFTEFSIWKKIWHIKRSENEAEIIREKISRFNINPHLIEAKSFKQNTFKSALWHTVVSYIRSPNEELQQAIIEANQEDKLDLMILVSHGVDSFEKFVKDDRIQIAFQFSIPVLIFQAKKI